MDSCLIAHGSAANAVIDLAVERHKKNLRSERRSAEQPQLVSVRDETDQACYVVDRVLEYRESGVRACSTVPVAGGPL